MSPILRKLPLSYTCQNSCKREEEQARQDETKVPSCNMGTSPALNISTGVSAVRARHLAGRVERRTILSL